MRIVLAALLAAPLLSAQADHVLSSPLGFDGTEGNGDLGTILGSQLGVRYQQVDRTWRGLPGTLTTLLLRRDGMMPDNFAYTARNLTLEIVMGRGLLETTTQNQNNNYVGQPTSVFSPKPINFPGWELQPLSTPASFDVLISWDQQWSYNGEADLLWELRITQNSGYPYPQPYNYPFDFHDPAVTMAAGIAFGTGCTATGRPQPFRLATAAFNHQTKFRLRLAASLAPSNAPVIAHLDATDPALSIPGLCALVHALPIGVLGLGSADVLGNATPPDFDNIPYDGSLVGQTLYLQAAALDPGQTGVPVVVSSGVRQTIPVNPPTPDLIHVYSYTQGGQTVFSGPNSGGVVAGFLHSL